MADHGDPEPEAHPVQARGPSLDFITIADLRARVAARGPRRWLIRGIWPAGDYGVHAAEPKAQKTWNTNDLAVAVASGTPWLGAFPIDAPGPVLMFVGEGGEGNTLRRLDAAAEARGLNADTLPIEVCTRAPHLNDRWHLAELAVKVEQLRPQLVTLDPLYLAAKGAELGDIYKMGALLENPQRICQSAGAALWVVTHFNRSAGTGSRRMTGAGPREWGRVLISAAVKSRHTDPETRASRVLTELDIEGGEIPDQTIRVNRRIWADDPDDLDSPLHMETTAGHSEDDTSPTGDTTTSSATSLPPAARKLIEAMTALDRPATIAELVDWIVEHHGHGLRRETCSRNLSKLLAAEIVDSIDQEGPFTPSLWFLTTPRDPRDITRDDHTDDSRVTSVTAPIGGHASRGHTSHDEATNPHGHTSDDTLLEIP